MRNLFVFCGSVFFLLPLINCASGQEPLGLVKQQPKSGRAIECPQGWMVPYSRTIPGTHVGFEMVPIPGGIIELESADQVAKIRVEVQPMWVSKYEVTWGEFKEYMKSYREFKQSDVRRARVDATYVTAPTELYSPEEVFQYSESDDRPACTMSQFAARQYSKWLSLQLGERYRLATRAEWLHACAAGDANAQLSAEKPMDAEHLRTIAVCETGDNGPKPVGSLRSNAWGLHDMLGNVSEWVIDAKADALGDARTHEERPLSVFDAISWPTSRYGHLALGANWQTPFAECSIKSHIVCDASWWELDPELPTSPWWLGGGEHWQAVGFRIVRPLHEGLAEQWTMYWEPDSEELKRDVSDSLESGRGVQGRPLPRKQLRDAPR